MCFPGGNRMHWCPPLPQTFSNYNRKSSQFKIFLLDLKLACVILAHQAQPLNFPHLLITRIGLQETIEQTINAISVYSQYVVKIIVFVEFQLINYRQLIF